MCCWNTGRNIKQCNRIENPKVFLYTFLILIFDYGRNVSLFNKCCNKCISTCKNIRLLQHTKQNINLKWVTGLNIRSKFIKLLEENIQWEKNPNI